MATEIKNRWKEVVQSLLAVAVLLVLFWLCRPGLFASGNGDGGVMGLFGPAAARDGQSHFDDCQRYDESDGAERDLEYGEILSMPVCTDLEGSIQRLQDARNNLLKAVVDQDAQAELDATAEYRDAVQEIQTGFGTLKIRLAPDEFSDVSQELLCLFDLDEQPLMPHELGEFAEDIWQ